MVIKLSLLKNDVKIKPSIVILCAGEGTRLKKITKTLPKPLIKIKLLNNISILQHTIHNLIKLDIKQIAVIIGYLGNTIREYISILKKNNQIMQDKLIIIDAKNQYKLGPLYSFLSITKNINFFTKNNYYMVIPGDTIFNYSILKEIFSIIFKNLALISKFPFIFYRNISLRSLKELYYRKKLISYAEIENINSEITLNKISQIKLKNIHSKDFLNQIIPICVLSYDSINEILNIRNEISIESVWEALNAMSFKGKKIYAYGIESKNHFYDIDYKNDLKKQKKKEKDNRCSD
jgi:NDP-sugar pyrophosphorylase family protein